MRTFGKWLGRVLASLILIGAALWLLGPYEPVDLDVTFDERRLSVGPEAYFKSVEVRFHDITPGTEKRIVWAGEVDQKTPVVVVYVHGFSATSEEIRPVPDQIAKALDANLIYTRLQGHGRGSSPMAKATAKGWMTDVAEALAVARRIGDEVIVISTSTGGTLMAAAALEPELMRDVKGLIFVSPNFGVNSPLAPVLTFPAARYWLPLVAGRMQQNSPRNEGHGTYWTGTYPTAALMPMAALVKRVVAMDFAAAKVPALFWFSMDDQVVRPDLTGLVAANWGGPVEVRNVTMGMNDDPYSHVIAGEIQSPDQTEGAVAGMLEWIGGL